MRKPFPISRKSLRVEKKTQNNQKKKDDLSQRRFLSCPFFPGPFSHQAKRILNCSFHDAHRHKALSFTTLGFFGKFWFTIRDRTYLLLHRSGGLDSFIASTPVRKFLAVNHVSVSTFHWSGLPFPPPGESSQSRDRNCVSFISYIGRWILYHCTTWEAPFNIKSMDLHIPCILHPEKPQEGLSISNQNIYCHLVDDRNKFR